MATAPPMFTLRIRDATRTQRLLFPNGEKSTWADLQARVKEEFGVPENEQLLSLNPPHDPSFITNALKTTTLGSLGLKHGAMLYLVNTPSTPSSTSTSTSTSTSSSGNRGATESKQTPSNPPPPTHKPTSRCQHGPRGRCLHCDGFAPGETPKFSNACNHGANTTCIHCSKHVQDKNAEEPAEWLCNHPTTVFCPKCIPPEDKKDDKPKIDVIPYKRLISERQALCSFRHDKTYVLQLDTSRWFIP